MRACKWDTNYLLSFTSIKVRITGHVLTKGKSATVTVADTYQSLYMNSLLVAPI